MLAQLRPTENRTISVSCPTDLAPQVVTVTATSVAGGVRAYEITTIA